jgi:hypothetical protein
MSIEELSNIIATGSALYSIIEHLMDVIDDADMSLFANAKEEVKSFLRPILEDARNKLSKDIYDAKERLENGVNNAGGNADGPI